MPRNVGRSARVSAMTLVTTASRSSIAAKMRRASSSSASRSASSRNAVSGVRRRCERSAACSRSAWRSSPIRPASVSSARLTSTISRDALHSRTRIEVAAAEPARDVGERLHRTGHGPCHAIGDESGDARSARCRAPRATTTRSTRRARARCAARARARPSSAGRGSSTGRKTSTPPPLDRLNERPRRASSRLSAAGGRDRSPMTVPSA